jgi:hypothetical protein
MALLLSRIFPEDISNFIYKIALNNYVKDKIFICTYNVPLLVDKTIQCIENDKGIYNLPLLLNRDLSYLILLLTFINAKFINPYKKWKITYVSEFKSLINNWMLKLSKFTTKYLNNTQYGGHEYKKILLVKMKINKILDLIL